MNYDGSTAYDDSSFTYDGGSLGTTASVGGQWTDWHAIEYYAKEVGGVLLKYIGTDENWMEDFLLTDDEF